MAQWFEQVLFASEVVEINVRIGLIRDRQHGQWLVEVKDPTDGRLIDMQSCPHFDLARWGEVMAEVASEIRQAVGDQIQPF